MPAKDVEGRPHYPHPPPGISRMSHLPTVESSIRYWDAIRVEAIKANDFDRARTATALRLSYEAARRELTKSSGRSGQGPLSRS
jgi:hypothetical protein